MALKYRNGVPTRHSFERLMLEFDSKFWQLNFGDSYGKNNGLHVLVWQSIQVQDRIDEFMDYAAVKGVKFGKYSPYESPAVGHLEILQTN